MAVLYPLISSTLEGADELLCVLKLTSSARELIVAVQEVVERLSNVDEDCDDYEQDETRATLALQFRRLLDVYSHGIAH